MVKRWNVDAEMRMKLQIWGTRRKTIYSKEIYIYIYFYITYIYIHESWIWFFWRDRLLQCKVCRFVQTCIIWTLRFARSWSWFYVCFFHCLLIWPEDCCPTQIRSSYCCGCLWLWAKSPFAMKIGHAPSSPCGPHCTQLKAIADDVCHEHAGKTLLHIHLIFHFFRSTHKIYIYIEVIHLMPYIYIYT